MALNKTWENDSKQFSQQLCFNVLNLNITSKSYLCREALNGCVSD